jgi:hypothetical protein
MGATEEGHTGLAGRNPREDLAQFSSTQFCKKPNTVRFLWERDPCPIRAEPAPSNFLSKFRNAHIRSHEHLSSSFVKQMMRRPIYSMWLLRLYYD